MRVRTTILLLLLLVSTALVAGWYAVLNEERKKFDNIALSRQAAWQKSVAAFLDGPGLLLDRMAEGCSSQEGALQAILDKNTEWAGRNWDDNTLRAFGANAIWVYDADGRLFFTRANTSQKPLAVLPADVLLLLKRNKLTPFFFSVEITPGGKRQYVEVRWRPVHAAWDLRHSQASGGAVFVGRIWNDEMIEGLKILVGDGQVPVIQLPDEDTSAHESPSSMSFTQKWLSWQGHPLAKLVITNENASLAALNERGDQLFRWLLVAALVLLGVLYGLLHWTVIRPLGVIIDGLQREELSKLEEMRLQKAEFGQLARLIYDFFNQRIKLLQEMQERSVAEKALRESEEMLRHSQKMEAVGRLAGGVAHDFNNLLTAIIGYADLLRQRFSEVKSVVYAAELIHQAGEQAAGLTRQLLAFSRKQLLQPKVIDLNAIIANLHRLLQRIIGEHIEIRAAPEAAPACVKADQGQIEQVIVNLGVNARDAMPRGGQLIIRTRNVVLTAADQVAELPPGEYIALEVTDTGEGMDEETKARIFEPFFTTKGPGKGTGLGLATVYGIVRQSRGGIVVESERGKGSTFRILLPRVDALAETSESAPATVSLAARMEAILVVEDEEVVRHLVCEILRGHGYRVLSADGGAEAVRLLRAESGRIDLLISDVVMPAMSGAEVAKQVREVSPKARVLFVSGYSENDMADQGLEELAFQVLQKPFTPAALAQKVREVLDAPPTG